MCDWDRQELNERLRSLVKEAQSHPPKSKGRQIALSQLVKILLQPSLICRPSQGQFPHTYEDIYDEARSKLLLYICENIDQYQPERSEVLGWVNFLMRQRFFVEAIKTILGNPGCHSNSDEIEDFFQPEIQPCLSDILREYLEEDPDNLFENAHIKNRSDANFKRIALARLDGIKWEEISKIFGISISALSDFYQRCIKKFAPVFRRYLQN